MILTAHDVRDAIKSECRLRRKKLELSIAYSSYLTVNEVWIKKHFYTWYSRQLIIWGVKSCKVKLDCDYKAGLFKELAKVYYASVQKINVADSPAIGEFWYTRESGTEHAINVMVTDSDLGSGTKVWFLEPQSGEEMFLTLSEKKSVMRVRM